MNILLFNDNPVVKKLVALSAQKTKDTLDSVGSLDDVEGTEYDLLIIDDALYGDDLFEMLKMGVSPKCTLLMATRDQVTPEGFNYVINKPFLPTDLVDMLAKIEKSINFADVQKTVDSKYEETFSAADFEEPEFKMDDEDPLDLESFDIGGLDDEIDLNDEINLDTLQFEDTPSKTTVLDHDEVQEVQNLLDDADSDDWDIGVEEDIIVKPIDDSLALEDEFDDLELPVDKNELDDAIDFPDDFSIDDTPEGDKDIEEEFTFDNGLSDDKALSMEDEEDDFDDDLSIETADEEVLLNDTQLDDLELQIQDAVSQLEPETLEKELELDEMDLDNLMDESDEIDDFDMDALGEMDPLDTLDEKSLKEAIGEAVEETIIDEIEIDDEDELEDTAALMAESTPLVSSASSNAEGIEALQILLKTLSNDEVAKALKNLNITININFGNEK